MTDHQAEREPAADVSVPNRSLAEQVDESTQAITDWFGGMQRMAAVAGAMDSVVLHHGYARSLGEIGQHLATLETLLARAPDPEVAVWLDQIRPVLTVHEQWLDREIGKREQERASAGPREDRASSHQAMSVRAVSGTAEGLFDDPMGADAAEVYGAARPDAAGISAVPRPRRFDATLNAQVRDRLRAAYREMPEAAKASVDRMAAAAWNAGAEWALARSSATSLATPVGRYGAYAAARRYMTDMMGGAMNDVMAWWTRSVVVYGESEDVWLRDDVTRNAHLVRSLEALEHDPQAAWMPAGHAARDADRRDCGTVLADMVAADRAVRDGVPGVDASRDRVGRHRPDRATQPGRVERRLAEMAGAVGAVLDAPSAMAWRIPEALLARVAPHVKNAQLRAVVQRAADALYATIKTSRWTWRGFMERGTHAAFRNAGRTASRSEHEAQTVDRFPFAGIEEGTVARLRQATAGSYDTREEFMAAVASAFGDSWAEHVSTVTFLDQRNPSRASNASAWYDDHTVTISKATTEALDQFRAGGRDPKAVTAFAALLHEVLHAYSPASLESRSHRLETVADRRQLLEWTLAEEGLVEWGAESLASRVLFREPDPRKTPLVWEGSYPGYVARVERILDTYGEEALAEIWAQPTSPGRSALLAHWSPGVSLPSEGQRDLTAAQHRILSAIESVQPVHTPAHRERPTGERSVSRKI